MGMLEKIAPIWSDPEEAYRLHSAGKTRKEFLMQMCSSAGNVHGLDKLKSAVMKEYNSDPQTAATLVDIFDLLAKNWSKILNVPRIDNLHQFISSLASNDVLEMPGRLTEGLYIYHLRELESVNLEHVAEKFGVFSDVATIDSKGNPVYYRVREINDDATLFLYKDARTKDILNSQIGKVEFLDKVAVLLGNVDFKEGTLFVDPSNYTRKGSFCSVTLGESVLIFPVIGAKSTKKIKYILCKDKDDNKEVNVVCLI